MTDCKQKLNECEERFKILFENSQVSTAITSFEGKIIIANDKYLDMIGCTRDEINEVDLKSMYRDIAQRDAMIKSLQETGKLRDFIVDLDFKEGTPYRNTTNADVINYNGQKAILVTAITLSRGK